ncbi:MAG: GNAT family N-acetyltransferase [Cyanobacteria bacterium P01_A01_bin.37]
MNSHQMPIQPERLSMESIQCVPCSLDVHDSHDVASLVYASAPDLFDPIFGRQAIALLTEFVGRSHNDYSHRYISVIEKDEAVLGAVVMLPAEAMGEDIDEAAVLNPIQGLRLWFVWTLVLRRILVHKFPAGTRYIANLAVRPEFRGQGLGTRLLQHCIEQAKQAGVSALFINVDMKNGRAQRLYESLGFQVIETHTMNLFGEHIGARLLKMSLNET